MIMMMIIMEIKLLYIHIYYVNVESIHNISTSHVSLHPFVVLCVCVCVFMCAKGIKEFETGLPKLSKLLHNHTFFLYHISIVRNENYGERVARKYVNFDVVNNCCTIPRICGNKSIEELTLKCLEKKGINHQLI
jgi:hypothetical protein